MPSLSIFIDVCQFVDTSRQGVARAVNVEFADLLANWQQNQFTSDNQMLMLIYKWKELE